MPEKLLALTQEILREAGRQRMTVGAVRLVKLLYLLEVEFYKANDRRLTNAVWRYYLYGPYPDEFRQLAETPGFVVEDVPLTGDRIFRKFGIEEDAADFASDLSPNETRLIPFILKEWGDASLNTLLNYVYFHTPPMRAARVRGEVLDFSTIPTTSGIRARIVLPSSVRTVAETPVIDLRKVKALYQEYMRREESKQKVRHLSPSTTVLQTMICSSHERQPYGARRTTETPCGLSRRPGAGRRAR